MSEIATSVLIGIGVIVSFLGSLGILRFPDIYSRLHSASKSSTLGIIGILVGAFVYFLSQDGHLSMKILLVIIFVFLTSPVSGQMISRAAYKSGTSLWAHSVRDDLKGQYTLSERDIQDAEDTSETNGNSARGEPLARLNDKFSKEKFR